MRYIRVEKDAYLRDTYFGNDGGWEEATGKEWFWFWNAPHDTTEVSSASLYTVRAASLPDMVSGGKTYLSLSYYPHRSTLLSTLSNHDTQAYSPNLSDLNYAVRMSEIKYSFVVNGSAFSNYDRLLPGGNFQIDSPPLRSS
ncbi:MAG: hypothetical protein M0P13_11520, partial [Fibrobacteraceae bacterium]|nr:hypothetical protein [Fibrobacteraceae bacterium]